jgi:hypothetical protein
MTRFALALALALALPSAAHAQDAKPAKVTVVFRGMATEEDAAAVRKVFATMDGVKVKTEDIQPGEKGRFGHYFSGPVVLDIADLNKTDLGHIGKAVWAVKTGERKDVPPPSLNLVLFTPNLDINSPRVRAMRAAVADVTGIEATKPGGLGGVPEERRYWIRIDDSGAATLETILAAVKKAHIEVRTEK